MPDPNLLAVPGGSGNGAFGSGLLNGWTPHGRWPAFDLATDISIGALTAPFAHCRSGWNDALADTAPLFSTVARYA
ncbi:hypothetical protein [Dankookia sp. P2]|uniref:hypothetical protein n=1 Tax=Dankookia sp. P2 TaxID=3423955 RepID=UPI003D668866